MPTYFQYASRVGPVGRLGRILLVAVLAAVGERVTADELVPAFAFVGSAGCVASNCHGNVATRATQTWKRSSVLWGARDPHRHGFSVLYAPRSVEIFERLTALVPVQVDNQGEPARIDPDQYLRFLEDRCVGCHATPPPRSESERLAMEPAAIRATQYALGVSCESCHGAAEKWQAEHYDIDWNKRTDADKHSKSGRKLTRALADRPGVCVDCHVGPQVSRGKTFPVDHDLIAAGHPRLDFEFAAAQANLPPHWDVQADQRRQGLAVSAGSDGATSTFHFDAWLAGQWQVARRVLTRDHAAVNDGEQVDLSHYDCFDCHHRLRGAATVSTSVSRGRNTAPRRSDGSVLGMRALFELERRPTTIADDGNDPQENALREFVLGGPLPQSSSLAATQRRQLLLNMTRSLRISQRRSWDGLVAWELALQAWLEDVDPQRESSLSSLVDELHDALIDCFEWRRGTQYDSPALFRAGDARWDELISRIRAELERNE